VTDAATDKFFVKLERPDGCDVGITTTGPEPSGSIQIYDKEFNHFHFNNALYRVFSFPLAVGKKWTYDYTFVVNGWTYTNRLSAEVVGVELVTVPAGTFETLRIFAVRRYRGEKTGRPTQVGWIEDTFWYSPDAKNFVRRSYSDFSKEVSSGPVIRELATYTVH
jgi:hypothetical protein